MSLGCELIALRISAVLFDVGYAADFLKSELPRRFFFGNGVLVYNPGVVCLFSGILLLLYIFVFMTFKLI